jgi:hypothetical protein
MPRVLRTALTVVLAVAVAVGVTAREPTPGTAAVNTYTGSYEYTWTDLTAAAEGGVFRFTRAYKSNDTRITELGPG